MKEDEEDYDPKKLVMEKKIGKGTFGDVYSGYIKQKKKLKVAIKRISKKEILKYGDYLIKAFFKELECMKKCECDNSVKYYSYFETENHYNIIMELCDQDLSSELGKRPKGFSTQEVKYIMSQLNNAFKKLYENDLIHRDLKLGNVLITYTDETKKKFIPKLCDYGFSKELNSTTTTETHLGTPATMAPEIMKNQKYNSKADLWSIGVIIYQLHFNGLPFPGFKEEYILEKIHNNYEYKKAEDPKLRDLISKLLVENPEKRLSWDEYFNHPFFAEEEKVNSNSSSNTSEKKYIKNPNYTFIKDFDIGFKNDLYKCFIAKDIKENKNVIIKSYNKDFIKSHELHFKIEYDLNKAFKGNEYIIQLIKEFDEENTRNLVYEFLDVEILSSYITHHDFTEEELQKLNKVLFQNIFLFNECNFKSFIFISIYSFAISKEGKPILFDFGLNKFFLSSDETISYYSSNESEIGNSLYQSKTNVMNYGITLLKCFYGNNLKLKINNKSFDLPQNKKMSNNFCKFLSKCLSRDISKRSSWLSLSNNIFVTDTINNNNKNENKEGATLFDDDKLKVIFESLNQKFELINIYYGNLELKEKDKYINEIESFLTLTLFEELMILNLFNRNQETQPFTSQQEISFIIIKNNFTSKRINLNFANPILSNLKLVNLKDNKLVSDFISSLKNHIKKLKDITLKIHRITKSSLVKGNYQQFLKNFIEIFESSNFHNYFFSLVKNANYYFQKKNFMKAYKEIPIAVYVCECILFVKNSMFESNKEKIYFNNKELINKFNEIFDGEENNKVEISVIKLSEIKGRYVIFSFLGVLFRYFKNSIDINQKFLKKNKVALDGLIEFYPSLMKLLVDTKNNIK